MAKKRSVLLSIILVLAVLLSACGAGGGSEKPAEGPSVDTESKTDLIVALQSEPASLDPHVASDVASLEASQVMYNTLFSYTETYGEVVPSLVEDDYEVSEDGLTYTFHLKEGVKFHSGAEMTSEDVVYSIQRIRDKGVRAEGFAAVESMETPDAQTVVLHLSYAYAPLLTVLANPNNAIVEKAVAEANGGDLSNVDASSGAFKLNAWEVGTSVTFDAFADYFEGAPAYQTLVLRTISDENAATTAIRNGEIDMIFDATDTEISVLENQGLEITSVPGTFWEYLGMNCESGVLQDKAVRQAIAYAIDREAINTVVKMGHATVLTDANIPATHEDYCGANTYAAQDLEKAKQLLSDAGYGEGDIKLVLKVGSDWQYQVDAAQIIKQQLAEVGIEVSIEAMESGVYFDDLNNGNFDLTVCGWSGFVDADEYLYNLFTTDGTYNQQNYSNPEVDEILNQARMETDPATRTELYKQAQVMIAEDAPMAFLYMNNFTIISGKHVKNITAHATATTIFLKDITF